MTTIPKSVTILRGGDGAFYLLTRELLEQARATPEVQAEIEAALAADDTGGHLITPVNSVPAATLLLPYFEVDLGAGGPFSIIQPPNGRPGMTPPPNIPPAQGPSGRRR